MGTLWMNVPGFYSQVLGFFQVLSEGGGLNSIHPQEVYNWMYLIVNLMEENMFENFDSCGFFSQVLEGAVWEQGIEPHSSTGIYNLTSGY